MLVWGVGGALRTWSAPSASPHDRAACRAIRRTPQRRTEWHWRRRPCNRRPSLRGRLEEGDRHNVRVSEKPCGGFNTASARVVVHRSPGVRRIRSACMASAKRRRGGRRAALASHGVAGDPHPREVGVREPGVQRAVGGARGEDGAQVRREGVPASKPTMRGPPNRVLPPRRSDSTASPWRPVFWCTALRARLCRGGGWPQWRGGGRPLVRPTYGQNVSGHDSGARATRPATGSGRRHHRQRDIAWCETGRGSSDRWMDAIESTESGPWDASVESSAVYAVSKAGSAPPPSPCANDTTFQLGGVNWAAAEAGYSG